MPHVLKGSTMGLLTEMRKNGANTPPECWKMKIFATHYLKIQDKHCVTAGECTILKVMLIL